MDEVELKEILSKENGTDRKEERNDLITYIKDRLTKSGIHFESDIAGTIFSINKGTPLFCCHTDSMKETMNDAKVKENIPLRVVKTKEGHLIAKRSDTRVILGGDDACGVFIVLNLIEKYKDTISFAFFASEETGMWGSRLLSTSIDFEGMFPYAILLDRMGPSDIVCSQNGYGSKEFEDALVKIGTPLSFSAAKGFISDADTLRRYTSTANISCGYHHPHSEKEYVIYEEVENTFNFCEKILQELGTTVFPKSDKIFSDYVETSLKQKISAFFEKVGDDFYGLADGKEIYSYFKSILK